jgi:phage head maturation protease
MKTKMPALYRGDVSFRIKSWNEEQRTVDLIWTTGARVRRRDWEGEFDEELEISAEAVDLSRLNSGKAPLLNSHDAFTLNDVIGVVEEAWIQGPKGRMEGRARVRFSDRDEVKPIIKDVRDGIIRNVSVGYSVQRWEKRQEKGDDVPVMRAVRWLPMEISLVPIPADHNSFVRSGERDMFETEIVTVEEDEMTTRQNADTAESAVADEVVDTQPNVEDKVETPAVVAAGSDPAIETRGASVQPEAREPATDAAADAANAERERCAGILLTCRKLGLPLEHAERLIADKTPLDQARANLIDLNAAHAQGTAVTSASMVRDGGETRARAMIDGLLFRIGHTSKPSDAAREHGYQHTRLVDLAREVLEENGVRTRGLSQMQVAELALRPGYTRMSGALHTTSDFAYVLSSVINTTLRDAYNQAPATFRAWARRATAPDFRNINRVQLSGAQRLKLLGEHGEYQRGTFTDSQESYRVFTYGQIVGITRHIVVNDYLDAFGRVPTALAQSAASLESDLVYAILLQNANMADGVPLFAAGHGNLAGTSGPVAVDTLNEAYAAMAIQSNVNGSPMGLSPTYLLNPPVQRATVENMLSTPLTPRTPDDGVPGYMRALTPVTEARLQTGITIEGPQGPTTIAGSTTAWYLLASTGMIDTVEYAYLEGNEGMYTETRNGFEIDGLEVKCRLDFGAKAIDYRGMFKNNG